MGCTDLTARVTGKILLDGKPLLVGSDERGMIVFRPVAGGPTCSGLISEKGTYEISTGSSVGLTPGDYLVSVRVIKLIPSPNKEEGPAGQPITPAVYADPLTSGLTYSVSSGENALDIKLSSSAGPAVLPVVVEPEATEEDPATGADGAAVEDPTDNETTGDAAPEDEAQPEDEATEDEAQPEDEAPEDETPGEAPPSGDESESRQPGSEQDATGEGDEQ